MASPPSSSSKLSKLFKFFTSKHNDTGSGGMATTSGGQGATSGGISGTSVANSDCGDSDENDDTFQHPSDIISQYLLQQFPQAKVAILDDQVWIDSRFDGPLRKDKLIRSFCAKFEPTYDPSNGVVSAVHKSF